jgi:hypothetical protein
MENPSNKIAEVIRGKKYKLVPVPGGEKEYASDVVYIPDFELLLKDLNRTLETFEGILSTEEVVKDPQFGQIYRELRVLRNNLRTHMRKNYPIEYNQIKGLFEMSATGTGGGFAAGQGAQYATKFAFKLAPKMKKIREANPGASLGRGPKAGPKGVTNNYYTKAFKYKLVNPEKLAAQSKAVDTKYLWGK